MTECCWGAGSFGPKGDKCTEPAIEKEEFCAKHLAELEFTWEMNNGDKHYYSEEELNALNKKE